MATADKKAYPIPEALTQGPWDISSGNPSKTILNRHAMVVPLTPDEHDFVVRTHEMAHAKWSPSDPAVIPKDVSPAILSAVEDFRVNAKAVAAGAHLYHGLEPKQLTALAQSLVEKGDQEGMILLDISTRSTKGKVDVRGIVETGLKPKYKKLLKWSDKQEPYAWDFSKAVGAAQQIQKTFDRIIQEEEEEKKTEAERHLRRSGAESSAMKDFEKKLHDDAGELSKYVEHRFAYAGHTKSDIARLKEQIASGVTPDITVDDWVEWGKMLLEEPPRKHRLPGRLGRRQRPADSGAVLAYPERLMSDARVFVRRQRSFGATVLIDGSGSMAITAAQVLAILKAAPGATVAIYGAPNTDTGILRILAKKGLYVDNHWICSPGAHNVIDLPALRWCAKGDEPRIWVSDGAVTAIGEAMTTDNWVEAHLFARRHRILRVNPVAEALDILKKIQLRRMGWLA